MVTLGLWLPTLCALIFPAGSQAQSPPSTTRIEEFLKTADVVRADPVGKGVTDTWRLTLKDGEITHDASFQSVDERAPAKDLGGGRTEVNFVDSYRYNIAAYRLARLLGLDDMVPASVERKWRTKTGGGALRHFRSPSRSRSHVRRTPSSSDSRIARADGDRKPAARAASIKESEISIDHCGRAPRFFSAAWSISATASNLSSQRFATSLLRLPFAVELI